MHVKRFVAPTMREALTKVKEELGPEAIILSNRKISKGIELVTTTDEVSYNDDEQVRRSYSSDKPARSPRATAYQNRNSAEAASVRSDSYDVRPEDILHRAAAQESLEKQQLDSENADALRNMQEQLGSIRSMLESRNVGDNWAQLNNQSPNKASVLRRLSRLALTQDVIKTIANQIDEADSAEALWRNTLEVLVTSIEVRGSQLANHGGVYAFYGAPGSGKTSTIGKIAAKYVLEHDPASIMLLSTDVYRIGGAERLLSLGRILDVDVEVLGSIEDIYRIRNRLQHKHLILVDTAGLNRDDQQLSKQMSLVSELSGDVRNLLVQSATQQLQVMLTNLRSYQSLSFDAAVLTHLDEAVSLGDLLSMLIKEQMPAMYMSAGQEIPYDLEAASAVSLVKQAIKLAKY